MYSGVSQEVIDELREMFPRGATPSHLIKHIMLQHPGRETYFSLIQGYFREAFNVYSIVRCQGEPAAYPGPDWKPAALNVDVVHRMLANQDTWKGDETTTADGRPLWYAGLPATEGFPTIEQLDPRMSPQQAELWPTLASSSRVS